MALSCSNVPINNGETIIFNWKNRKHFDQWEEMDPDSEPVSVMRAPSSSLPVFKIDQNIDEVTIVALTFGEKEDYSDHDTLYYIVVQNQAQNQYHSLSDRSQDYDVDENSGSDLDRN